jgi:hypothetical protein
VVRHLVLWLSLLSVAGCCTAGPGRTVPLPNTAFDDKVRQLREDYRFTVVAVPPFVVIGGGPAAEVRAFSREVVAWGARLLMRELFDRYPSRIVEIWALRTSSSYLAWAGEAIGRTPSSAYGVYVPCAGAIVVNRGLGDGTLVHEMVHVLVEVDFPNAPTWLNEGLGSLYEEPGERHGRIVGRLNWRLPALQHALARRRAPSLRDVMTMSRASFYGDGSALHYAVARYLLYHLQQRGELRSYYRGCRDGGDPIATLERVVGEPLERYEQRWRRFVLSLDGDVTPTGG